MINRINLFDSFHNSLNIRFNRFENENIFGSVCWMIQLTENQYVFLYRSVTKDEYVIIL
jgi:hypothetical protein